MAKNTNPRGEARPQNGQGGGVGKEGGRRGGKNTAVCKYEGPGKARGAGQGGGSGRIR